MTAEMCPACTGDRTVLVNESRRNERRLRNGQRPVLTEINRVKARMAGCAATGHATQRKQEAAAVAHP